MYDPKEHVAGGSFGWFIGAPVRFFSQFGILGAPFIAAYSIFLIVAFSAAICGFIWFSVICFMYLLFG